MNPITETDKLRLTEYLIARGIEGISGRDGEDLVDIAPSRAIFSGVLPPPRHAEIAAAQQGATGGDAPAGTALGLDFRIVPDSPEATIELRIFPKWSLYYPVFPTWEQAREANSAILGDGNHNTPGDETSVSASTDPSGGDEPETSDESTDADSEAVETDDEASEEKGPVAGKTSLPRVFRRYDVRPDPLTIHLPTSHSETVSLGGVELADAIQRAVEDMLADPSYWRHLAEPAQRERSLGEISVLSTADVYSKALASVSGAPVTLPAWSVGLQVEAEPDTAIPEAVRLRILLSNTTAERDETVPDPGLEERSLLDAGIVVEVNGGRLEPFDFLLAPKDYRSNPQMLAKGINCTAVPDSDVPNLLRTECLPTFRQPHYRTRDDLEIPFESLDVADPTPVLDQVAHDMDRYLAAWDTFLNNEAMSRFNPPERDACASDRDAFAREIEVYRLGIETLRRDPKLAVAFRFMNRCFARLGKASGGKIRAWRLFQIGFIVSQLPALAVRELSKSEDDDYSEAVREAHREVGILWFPTGGGKTEAYLGLLSVALLFDRLRGKTRGVCAWMRFPLRMLSLQQLERLARVIAVLNQLRAEEPSLKGGDPFAIGYYVGDGVTPNSVSSEDMIRYEKSGDLREEVRLLRKCPFCGAHVEIRPQRARWRLSHVCPNSECFSNTSDSLGPYKGSLPVCIVDSEIYRFLPSVLVGTVDKLAIIGRNKNFAHLVRGVKQQCPEHGYTSYDECIERWGASCNKPKRDLVKLDPVKDPGPSLLIQDELHLLRAELGVFNGHYEGLLQHLGNKAFLAPKVLAATATIEAYDVHAFHLYLSRAWRYPQPAWENGESFYATSRPTRHRRHYVGLLCHTRGIEEPALRLLTLQIREVRRLKSDPRRAAGILGRPDATDAMVQDALRLYDLSLVYVNRKSTGGSLIDKMPQADRVLGRENLGTVQPALLTGDQNMDQVGAVLERIERERDDTAEARLDVVAATNLISHGVDLERFNHMVVCGMPSHYAEYVQSSSRAARSHPGVVFVCFKARDPRETSQYEFFWQMHEHMDRLIEAVAVNRFASFAPRKTVPGLLAGVLLCDLTPDLFGVKITKPLDYIPVLQVALGMKPAPAKGTIANCVNQDQLRQAIRKIIGVDTVHPPASPAQVTNLQKQVDEVLDDQFAAIGRTLESRLSDVLNPITSFRDVDEGIDFGSITSASLVTRLRAR